MTAPAKPYTPRFNSLPWKVCAYFKSNPSEELSAVDIAFKFGVHAQGVQACLTSAVEAQALVRLRNTDLEWVYGPGKAIDTLDLPADQPATAPAPIWPTAAPLPAVKPLPAPNVKAAATPTVALELPPLDALQIDDNVPMPTPKGPGANRAIYSEAVLAKLKVGQSVALPLTLKYTLAVAATAAKKAQRGQFCIRQFPDTQTLRVWRVS